MRYIALDVGDATIGVAVSDPMGLTAQPVQTIERIGWKKDSHAISELIEKYSPCELVVGLPKNMDGTLGFQAEKVLAFSKRLENRFKLKIHMVDERLTTVSAQRALIEADVSRSGRKKVIDSVAACFILNLFLEMKGRRI